LAVKNRYITTAANRIFGNEEDFSMENRMFTIGCFAIFSVLFIFFIAYAALHVWLRTLIIFFVLVCEAVFYYYSRFKKKFRLSFIINAVISYIMLSLNYLINSGIDGPTVFLFFFTLHVLISATPKNLHVWWLMLHAVTVSILLFVEYYRPFWVVHSYSGITMRTVDIYAWYVTTLLLMYMVTRQLRNYYINEKYETENTQIKLRAFFDSSSNYHVLLNKQMELIYFNKATAKFIKAVYNRVPEEGQGFSTYINPAYIKKFNEGFNLALAGKTNTEELCFEYNNVGKIWWQLSFIPARDKANNVIAVSFNSVNINDRKEKEEQIKQKNKSLLEIAYLQQNVLRQPVASLIGLMNLIKDDKSRSAEYLQLMEVAAGELDNKIRAIVAQTSRV